MNISENPFIVSHDTLELPLRIRSDVIILGDLSIMTFLETHGGLLYCVIPYTLYVSICWLFKLEQYSW